MREHYKRIIKDCELRAEHFLKNQVTDPSSEEYGGYKDENEIVQPKTTIYKLTTLLALYHTETSRFYRDAPAYERIGAALDYVAKYQRPGGTFDLVDCNFLSAPDTAFCAKRLLPSCRYLRLHRGNAENDRFREKIENILANAAEGIMNGGFHTPNHRWVIASVLTALGNLFENEAYRQKAREYLREGIDCGENGEYAERSSGNYNRICNDAMILLYEETGDAQYLEYAARNLKMMLMYMEPDGSVFTMNSTRFDKERKMYPDNYYCEYLYMAHRTGEKAFAAAANQIMENIVRRGAKAPDCLDLLMQWPQLIDYEYEGAGFPETYVMDHREQGIVRCREGNYSFSVLKNNPQFFRFQAGGLAVRMRIGVSFFTLREFSADTLEKTEGGCALSLRHQGWFCKPLREKPETSDWWRMDHSGREKAEGPFLGIRAEVRKTAKGAEVRITTEGCDRVPVKVEIGMEPGCSVKSEGFILRAGPGQSVVARSGMAEIQSGCDGIRVGPAFGRHAFLSGHDDGEKASGLFRLVFTDFTDFDRTVTFEKI